jgi:hypothetical protein
MPGTATTYDEGCIGATNPLRLADMAGLTEDVYAMGNLVVGGVYGLDFQSRYVGTNLKNYVICNNVFGGPAYTIFADMNLRAPTGAQANVAVFGNIRPDGSPASRDFYSSGSQDPVNGVFSFNKSLMSAKWRYTMMRHARMLNWNGDLLPEYNLGST